MIEVPIRNRGRQLKPKYRKAMQSTPDGPQDSTWQLTPADLAQQLPVELLFSVPALYSRGSAQSSIQHTINKSYSLDDRHRDLDDGIRNSLLPYRTDKPTHTTIDKRRCGAYDSAERLPASLLFAIRAPSGAAPNRMQLRSRFVDLFFPQTMRGPFPTLFGVPAGPDQSGSITIAADAICLLQLGTSFRDAQLIHQYRDLYGKALRSLRRELDRPRASSQDSVRNAVYLLGICEYYCDTDHDSPGWMSHMGGFMSMIQNHPSGDVVSLIAAPFPWRHLLSYGLAARRALPSWAAASIGGTLLDRFTVKVLPVPGILQKLDRLLKFRSEQELDHVMGGRATASEKAVSIVEEALCLRQELQTWMINWSFTQKHVPYTAVPISTFPEFLEICGPLHDVYNEAFQFSTLMSGALHRLLWTCLLLLDQSLLAVCSPDFCDELLPQSLERDAEIWAANLCKGIAYTTAPELGGIGAFSVHESLHFVEKYYEKQCAHREVAWCRRVRKSTVTGWKVAQVLSESHIK